MKTVLFFLMALPLFAQNPSNQDLDILGHFNMAAGTWSAPFIPIGVDPTGACTTANAVVMNTATGQLTGCIGLIWTPLGGAGSGNVSGPGSSTNFALAAWNGTSGLVLRNTSVITDGSGNLTANSLTTSGGGAGTIELTQGTVQGSFPANSVSLYAPATISSAYQWKLPAADAAGCIKSDGSGTLSVSSCTTGAGSVTSIATTSPITGGTITSTGTIACATCVTSASSLTSGQLMTGAGSQGSQIGNLSGDVTTSGGTATTIANNAVTSAKSAVVNTRRVCSIVIGADNSTAALADADLAPQGRQCSVPFAATVVEVTVAGNAGTPNVIVAKNHAGSLSDFTSAALATASAGALACSNTGGTTGIDGATTCSATLQNTSLAAGDWIETHSATAGGTAKRMSIAVVYTVN